MHSLVAIKRRVFLVLVRRRQLDAVAFARLADLEAAVQHEQGVVSDDEEGDWVEVWDLDVCHRDAGRWLAGRLAGAWIVEEGAGEGLAGRALSCKEIRHEAVGISQRNRARKSCDFAIAVLHAFRC